MSIGKNRERGIFPPKPQEGGRAFPADNRAQAGCKTGVRGIGRGVPQEGEGELKAP